MGALSPSPDRDSGGLRVHLPGEPQRDAVEAFIRRVYADRYGASIANFAPVLVSLADAAGGIAAAAGYRGAGAEPLFLERYLAGPVEEALADGAGRKPVRAQVVEVGHLAAAQPGAGRRLVLLLGPHLAHQRFRWAVATLTSELLQLFGRLGIAPIALAPADPARLGADAALWGSYYEHEPVVLAGEIQPALRRLARRTSVSAGAAT